MKKYYLNLFIEDGWSIFAEYLKKLSKTKTSKQDFVIKKIYSHKNAFHDELENDDLKFWEYHWSIRHVYFS